jgi:hypothetical protein
VNNFRRGVEAKVKFKPLEDSLEKEVAGSIG